MQAFFAASFGPDYSADTGVLAIDEQDGATIVGALADVGFTSNTFEFLFDVEQGRTTADVARQVLLEVTFLEGITLSELESFTDYTAETKVFEVAPIPLPGSVTLMLAALAGLGVARRKS